MTSMIWFPAHLAARRRSVHPTAIGLTPLPVFSKAMREAPKKKGHAKGAVLALEDQIDESSKSSQ